MLGDALHAVDADAFLLDFVLSLLSCERRLLLTAGTIMPAS